MKFNFEENKGQIKDDSGYTNTIKFKLSSDEFNIFITATGLTYQYEKSNINEISKIIHLQPNDFDDTNPIQIETHRVDLRLLNSNNNPHISKLGKSSDYLNYYTHNIEGVFNYEKLIFHEVYPNIDWILYILDNKLKYDFILRPGARLSDIQWHLKGQDTVKIDSAGVLKIYTKLGLILEKKPIAYQESISKNVNFKLQNQILSYEIEKYDINQELVLDPEIAWSTYHKGDIAFMIKADSKKNIYINSQVASSIGMAHLGHQLNYQGSADGLLVKFNSAGTRIWSTYYGGTGDDWVFGLEIDSADNIYIAGHTTSTNQIGWNTSKMTNHGLTDGFIAKFDTTGKRIWGTYFGGNKQDYIYGICTGDSAQVYVVGQTATTAGLALNGYKNLADTIDAFVSRFDSTGNLIWSSYFGGSSIRDVFHGCSYADGYVYAVGVTRSVNLPFCSNVHQPSFYNPIWPFFEEGMIAKFGKHGNYVWSSYYGGSQEDLLFKSIVRKNHIYLIGQTRSPINISFNGYQNSIGGYSDMFLVKLDTSCKRIWSSYIGGNNDDFLFSNRQYNLGLDIDESENIFVNYYTNSSNIGYKGLKNTTSGASEIGYTKIDSSGKLIWSSYFGGWNSEFNGDILSIDKNTFYLSGTTMSSSGIAINGWQNSLIGSQNLFLTKFICSSDSIISDSICKGDSVQVGGKYYHLTGTYYDTLDNWENCDSFITLHLTVLRKDTTYLFDTICSGTNYVWNGGNRTMSGVYRDTLINNLGCDSFLILNLLVKRTDTVQVYDTSCNNLPKTFNGQNLTLAGVYRDTLTNIVGCDSHIFYHFMPKPVYEIPLSRSICSGDSSLFGWKYYKQGGIFYDTLKTIRGCDSVLKLTLTINPLDTNRQTQSICRGKSHNFYSQVLTSQGTYSHKLTNKNGCDSLILMTISVIDSSTYSFGRMLCSGQSFFFNNQTLTQAGVYRDTFMNYLGCDSFVTLNLSFGLVLYDTLRQTVCAGQVFRGYPSPGNYKETYTSNLGCDSILTIYLKHLPATEYKTISHSKCGAFRYGSRTYTQNDSFTETIKNYLNCDSIVTKHLVYITEPQPKFLADKTIAFCEEIIHKGQRKTTSFFSQDTVKSLEFPYCDSLYQPYYYRRENRPILTAISKQTDTVIKGEATNIQVSGAQNYRWTTGEQSQSIRPQITEDKIFEVTAWNLADCEEKMQFNIYAIDQPLIDFPTAFSPNGDGLNDYFTPNTNGNITIDYFQIYNRWGEKVYEHSFLSKGWDGSYLGKPAANGVYTYTLRYSYLGRVFTRSGEVMVVR